MKIERISDNQVKFILNQTDLENRNIHITELAYGSEKTQALFREMMEQATEECGFEADNVPLMIEAIPFLPDSITIIVTKVNTSEEMEERFNLLPTSNHKPRTIGDQKEQHEPHKQPQNQSQNHTDDKKHTQSRDTIAVYSFDSLDQVTNASVRIYGQFNGTNILFKNQNRYFLFLESDHANSRLTQDELNAVLSEYGQKHISNAMSKTYLDEHGEVLIKHPAITMMAMYLGTPKDA